MQKSLRNSFLTLLVVSALASSTAFAKWIDPEKEAMKNHTLPAWQGVDFTFTGFSSSTGTSAFTYHNALNDFWQWNGGAGLDSLGWFLTAGGRYFVYNGPKTTCFFLFSCHGQVAAGMNLNYANGGRKTYTSPTTGDAKYDQGSSLAAWPVVAFRSIYREFFSLSLDVGYRIMLQKPTISRGHGIDIPGSVEDMDKANNNGFGASVSLGLVF